MGTTSSSFLHFLLPIITLGGRLDRERVTGSRAPRDHLWADLDLLVQHFVTMWAWPTYGFAGNVGNSNVVSSTSITPVFRHSFQLAGASWNLPIKNVYYSAWTTSIDHLP